MDRSQIDQIIESNNIIDVIGSYISLKRTGSNFKARCPFHDEKTASFVVSEKKQIYKCFGCGKAGNVISFVKDYEKISFIDALKKLASRAGIMLDSLDSYKKKNTKRDLILTIYKLAQKYYQENLDRFGDEVKKYLVDRNISEKVISDFQLGYALNSFNGLRNYLNQNHINSSILPQTGLFGENQRGQFDLFRERLMFPIHSHTGQVVAFGGRILSEGQPGGKYINSPTTEIYTKGDELYGLFKTKYEIGKKKSVLIAEGYMDFLRLYEAGFTNSVASLGTALTKKQINLLSRYTANFYMLYDGDKAGNKAAFRAAKEIIKQGNKVFIVSFPEDQDPDSFLVKHGNSALQEKIDTALSICEFIKRDKLLGLDTKAKIKELVEVAGEIQDSISKELFIKEVADTFGISERAISSSIKNPRKQTVELKQAKQSSDFSEERMLIKYLLNNFTYTKEVAQQINPDYLFSNLYKAIYKKLLELSSDENLENISTPAQLLEHFSQNEKSQNVLGELIMDETELNLEDLLKDLTLRKIDSDVAILNERLISFQENPEIFNELLLKKTELKKKRNIILSGVNTKLINLRGINAKLQ